MVGVALDAPPPASRAARGVRRAWHTRLSGGHLVMLLAGLLGALATTAALRHADHRVEVLVARADLAPGTVVHATDLRRVRVSADAGAMGELVRADAADAVVGHVVTARVAAGHFVTADDVQRAGSSAAARSMSFAIDRSRAVDGALVAGDRVDVIALDTRTNVAQYVATNVEILHVGGASARSPLTASDAVTVTLAVDGDTALSLAGALRGHDLTLVRSTGAPSIVDAAAKG